MDAKTIVTSPSIKQMQCRLVAEHKTVLRHVYAGTEIPSQWQTRAHFTAYKTLLRWGCVSNGQLTPKGLELASTFMEVTQ